MLKTVILTLANVRYSGDSIGDDIRIEAQTLGQLLRIDKKIMAGTSVIIGQDISSFETDQNIFKTTAHSTVIEKDILFNGRPLKALNFLKPHDVFNRLVALNFLKPPL